MLMDLKQAKKNVKNHLSRQVVSSWSVDAESISPICVQLAEEIKKNVISQCNTGDFLPSENQMAQTYGVYCHTVRRALDELVIQGLITRHQGKGTQVLDKHKIQYQLNIAKFSSNIERHNHSAGAQLIGVERVKPTDEQKDIFSLSKKRNLILIKTLRFVNDELMSFIHHYLNPAFVKDIDKKYQSGSLHSLIKQEYGLKLTRAEVGISARLPLNFEVVYLRCHQTQPLLITHSINCVKGGVSKVVECSLSASKADRMRINVSY